MMKTHLDDNGEYQGVTPVSMTDIVERLRDWGKTHPTSLGFLNEAADEIERLRAENELLDADCESLAENNDKLNAENAKLREALEQLIAAAGPQRLSEPPKDLEYALGIARAALQRDEGE